MSLDEESKVARMLAAQAALVGDSPDCLTMEDAIHMALGLAISYARKAGFTAETFGQFAHDWFALGGPSPDDDSDTGQP